MYGPKLNQSADLGLYPLAGRPAGHGDQRDPGPVNPAPLMPHTSALVQWRDLLAIVRRVDAVRQTLSRLDGTGVAGIHRRIVETEIATIQELLAKQANTLTVYTLQAEVERRHAQGAVR